MRLLIAFTSGLLFGTGLTLSRMIDPAKVLSFLDLAGSWDPSLAFVMLGALAITVPAFALARRMQTPLCAEHFNEPTRRGVDTPLAIGAVLFGVGWGLVGFCPGPALAALGIGGSKVVLFVVAMLAGMAGYAAMDQSRSRAISSSS